MCELPVSADAAAGLGLQGFYVHWTALLGYTRLTVRVCFQACLGGGGFGYVYSTGSTAQARNRFSLLLRSRLRLLSGTPQGVGAIEESEPFNRESVIGRFLREHQPVIATGFCFSAGAGLLASEFRNWAPSTGGPLTMSIGGKCIDQKLHAGAKQCCASWQRYCDPTYTCAPRNGL